MALLDDNMLKNTGRLFYALGVAGLGVQQFIYPGFRPVFVPMWPENWPSAQPWVYAFSVVLIALGFCIALNVHARKACLISSAIFLLFFLFLHIPFRLSETPEVLASWTNAFKILAFSGSSLIVAQSFPKVQSSPSRLFDFLERVVPFGRFFFGIMLFVFGVDHFLYAEGVSTLVPAWIPGKLFWTYFAGVALIGAGFSFMSGIKLRQVAMLTGLMIFAWFLVLHIPRAVAMPDLLNGNEITSVMQALAFSGVAFVAAAIDSNERKVSKNRRRDLVNV
jgi:uncharacterized membrane protein YphA (DoxX/SURF4 family)